MDLTPITSSLIILAHTMTANYMDVDPEKVRPIKAAYTLPIKQLPKVCGAQCQPPSTAIYRQHIEKIYLGVKPYYKDRFIFSQLLHETVHHFQYVLGVKNRCENEEELHAVKLQGIYLQSKGAKWWDASKNRDQFNNGKCN